ncbi:hypothetical protein OROGR_004713 [Orobanche gracilis]
MNTRSARKELVPYIPEVEAFARKSSAFTKRSRRNLADEMVNTSNTEIVRTEMTEQNNDQTGNEGRAATNTNQTGQAIRDHFRPRLDRNFGGITNIPINATNFELKPALISMVQQNQFGGFTTEDPHAHLHHFMQICDTVKMNGVSDDAIKLKLFPFSLREKARNWLGTFPRGSISSWEDLSEKFLFKFFPPNKTMKLKSEITQFRQMDGESLYEAWERFKDMLRRCPRHGFPEDQQLCFFYNGLMGDTRNFVDVAAGGALLARSADDAYNQLEEMAMNSYQWPMERSQYKHYTISVHMQRCILVLQPKYSI